MRCKGGDEAKANQFRETQMTSKALGRLAPLDGQPTMKAIVTMGNGGYDQLVYRDVARPVPGSTEVLVQVRAAGMNNTEINTRLGWYSSVRRRMIWNRRPDFRSEGLSSSVSGYAA